MMTPFCWSNGGGSQAKEIVRDVTDIAVKFAGKPLGAAVIKSKLLNHTLNARYKTHLKFPFSYLPQKYVV